MRFDVSISYTGLDTLDHQMDLYDITDLLDVLGGAFLTLEENGAHNMSADIVNQDGDAYYITPEALSRIESGLDVLDDYCESVLFDEWYAHEVEVIR